jgi:hypothetical protein
MRARKNPPPFTLENLLRELKPGRSYSPEAVALTFAVSVDAARAMVLGAVMLGEMRESVARKGIRKGFWIPRQEPRNLATRRIGPLVNGGTLAGYTATLWSLHDLCMASRGQPELMRYPPARPVVKESEQTSDGRRVVERDPYTHKAVRRPEQIYMEGDANSRLSQIDSRSAGRAVRTQARVSELTCANVGP